LAVAAARDEDQRALLRSVLDAHQRAGHDTLLTPPSTTTSWNTAANSVQAKDGRQEVEALVSLAALAEQKTALKVSELRLKRRVAVLELSEMRERESASEAAVAREVLEESLVRCEEQLTIELSKRTRYEAEVQKLKALLREKNTNEAVLQRQLSLLQQARWARAAIGDELVQTVDGYLRHSQPSAAEVGTSTHETQQLAEVVDQLARRDAEAAQLTAELKDVRSAFSTARTELLREQQTTLRKDELISELQAACGAATPPKEVESRVSHLTVASTAGRDVRSARMVNLAQDSLRAQQAKLHQQEEAISRYQQLLAEAREALRREKAEAALESERLSDRLYRHQEAGISQLQLALGKVDTCAERSGGDFEMTSQQLEDLLLEKDEQIARLRTAFDGVQQEILALQLHTQDHVEEIEMLSTERDALLEQERKRGPSNDMQKVVSQFKSHLRRKERELRRMKQVIAILKDDLERQAATNQERLGRVTDLSAKADARAVEHQTDERICSRISQLQERLHGLSAEVRTLKHREGLAVRQASGVAGQLVQAEALATRQSVEICRLQTDLSAAKALQHEWHSREQAFQRQLEQRTMQLEALQRGSSSMEGAVQGATTLSSSAEGGFADVSVAEAVACAVEEERTRWTSVRTALAEMQARRLQLCSFVPPGLLLIR
jgi:hypothetical protein